MRDGDRTKHRPANELARARQRIQDLETSEAEWKQEIEASLKSEQKWKALVNSLSDGFILLDSELNVVDVSTTAWFYRLGLAKENMLGKNIAELVPDTRNTGIYDRYVELIRTAIPTSVESTISRPKLGGMRLDADVALKAFRVGDGLGIIATDLTGLMRREHDLQESEKRYRLLADNVADVIWTTDMNLRTTYVSPSVKRMLGYTVEEALTLGARALLAPGSFEPARKTLQKAFAIEKEDEKDPFRAWAVELELICKDRSSIWTESMVTLLRDSDSQPIGLLGITRDIMERRRAHELFSTLANNTPLGVYIEQDGTFQFVNFQLQEYAGYSKDELIGMNGMRFVYPKDRNSVIASAVKMLKGERTSPYEYRFVKKDGEIRWVMGRVTSIQYNGRRAALGSFMDVTEHKQAEQKLRRSASQLRMLSNRIMKVQEEERGRIARELHDEIGQQLFALKIEAESLAERVEDSLELRDRARRLMTLSDQLRATSQRIAVRIRPGVLDELGLVKAMEWYAEDFERRSGISCPVEAPTSQIVTSEATAVSAYRILQEALVNVWQHARASQVKVKISAKRGMINVCIADNGAGVDLGSLSDSSSLGLLGMRERARLVGGTLTVQSKPGRGVRVTARLPMHTD